MSRWLSVLLRFGFGLTGVAFMVVTFLRTWDSSRGLPLPSWPAALATLPLALLIPVLGFRSWAQLLERPATRSLAVGFFIAQLGKYTPGGVWQAIGQVGYAIREGVPGGSAATALVLNSVAQAVAGILLGLGLLVDDALPMSARVAIVIASTLALLLVRPVLLHVLTWLLSLWRPGGLHISYPTQRSILWALACNATALLAAGFAFSMVLAAAAPTGWRPVAVPAFALAWSLGFLAIPFPAGVGVREAVLVATLGATTPGAAIIASSVVLRLLLMVAEGVLVVGSYLARAQSGGTSHAEPRTSSDHDATEPGDTQAPSGASPLKPKVGWLSGRRP